LRRAALWLVLAVHAHAGAQVSGSVALVSDYLYRGVTLSDGKPVPQLTLVYDHPDGWYLGAFASRIRQFGAVSGAAYVSYAGYARRLASGNSWEAGVSSYAFPASSGLNFQEVYAGLATQRIVARLSYSPNYLFQGLRTVYGEMSSSQPLRENLSLFAHAGYLGSLREGAYQNPVRRTDARIGLGVSLNSWEAQLAWAGVHQRRAAAQTYGQGGTSEKMVLSLMRRF
jgi:uncharacterized protein (TIGR02001 family)